MHLPAILLHLYDKHAPPGVSPGGAAISQWLILSKPDDKMRKNGGAAMDRRFCSKYRELDIYAMVKVWEELVRVAE